KYLNTEAELRDMLVGLVGGRAAEEVVFDTVTTGAANDIERATEIARSMVTRYGMSKKFGLVGLATIESQYLEGRAALNCSDETAAAIDEEVVAIIKESYDKALELLRENRELMDKLAAFLIEKETITGKEFMEIFRKEKGIPEPEEKKETEKADTDNSAGEADKAEETAEQEAEADKVVEKQETPTEKSSADAVEEVTVEGEPAETEAEEAEADKVVETQDELPPYLRYQAPADNADVGRFSNGRIDKDDL
ncbi:MAG: hypothetical protein GX638_19490, partial [Crenarchaeota archaeon]|nr:hypothetical protein [Thermoproteota archaeon]